VYAMPETAVDALAVLRRARELRTDRAVCASDVNADVAVARRIVEHALSQRRTGLFFDEGAEILAAYGIPVCPFAYLESVPQGRDFLERVGFPVVAKVDSPEMLHRFEQGAVITGIESEGALASAIERLRTIATSLGLIDARFLVQKTVVGRELIFGLERDPAFGPVVMFGIGGTLVEALRDVAFAVAPVSFSQAERTIRSIRAFPLLETFRGQPAVSLEPLSGILAALAQLGLDMVEIAEADLNPIVVGEEGAVAVDLLIKLCEADP
jgi:acyl-CoA synthetase (NDP forming)